MAIINTFKKCLESPFLAADPSAPAESAGLMVKASEALGAASSLLNLAKPDPTDVGSMASMAMFSAIRALVYARGYRESGMKCLLIACDDLWVKPGLLDGRHLRDFEKVQGFQVPPADAVEAARGLLDAAKSLLGAEPGRG